MSRPKPKEFSLPEAIAKIKGSGLNPPRQVESDEQEEVLPSLPERIQRILNILQPNPIKSTTMNYFIMYDIENNKIRKLIAKYLLKKGCIRVQKSVFLCHSDHKKFDEIREALAVVNEVYDNKDSIILVPINISDARSMKLIGHNVNIQQIIDPPNTVFL
jgi:CRISPR-associated endonuclease Cas2